MPKMILAQHPMKSVQVCPIALSSITYKNEIPRNDGDISVVSIVGTPILKLARALISKGRGRVFARKNDHT